MSNTSSCSAVSVDDDLPHQFYRSFSARLGYWMWGFLWRPADFRMISPSIALHWAVARSPYPDQTKPAPGILVDPPNRLMNPTGDTLGRHAQGWHNVASEKYPQAVSRSASLLYFVPFLVSLRSELINLRPWVAFCCSCGTVITPNERLTERSFGVRMPS
jgi:hypothetical protein